MAVRRGILLLLCCGFTLPALALDDPGLGGVLVDKVVDQTLAEALVSIQEGLPESIGNSTRIKLVERPEDLSKVLGPFRKQVLPEVQAKERRIGDVKVTANVSDFPVLDLIELLVSMAGGRTIVHDGTVFCYPDVGTFDPLISKEFAHTEKSDGRRKIVDLRPKLAEAGVVFYEGCEASYDPGKGKVLIVNTQQQLDKIDALTD